MAPRELDPLLPQNEPAPEISGYGTKSYTSYHASIRHDAPPAYESAEEDEDNVGGQSVAQRALSSLAGIFTVVVFFAFIALMLSPSDWQPRPPPPPGHNKIEERVERILHDTPLFDGHNDLAILIRGAYKNKIHDATFKKGFEDGGLYGDVDLPRLRKGRAGGAFWSAFVVCPENAGDDFSDAEYSGAVAHTLSQIDLLHRLQAQYPDDFTPAGSKVEEALKQFHKTRSMLSPISIEGLHQIPQSAPLSTLRLYYLLGVRAATLTWNCHNAFADAALIWNANQTVVAPYHRGGLTSAGREVITEMNRLGMLVDLSHTSYWTQKAVLSNGTSAAPVIYSHSSAFALCQHPRNVHDDILELVKQTKSLVMVNFSPGFISCSPPADASTLPEFDEKNNTVHQVARHVVYIGEKIGYDYVGLGSDFDGMGDLTPRGLEGVDKYPALIAELLVMGVSDEDARKVAGENLLRVWRKAEEVSEKLQKKDHEGEDDVHGYDL
jgi:membrane dipeptidase